MRYQPCEDGPAYCKVFVVPITNQNIGTKSPMIDGVHYAGDDLMIDWVNYFHSIVLDPVRISSILGIFDHDQERTVSSFGTATPRPRNFEYSERDDVDNYGPILGERFTSPDEVSASSKEKQVIHTRYEGSLLDEVSSAEDRFTTYFDGGFMWHAGFVPLESRSSGFTATGVTDEGFLTFHIDSPGFGQDTNSDALTLDLFYAFKRYAEQYASSPGSFHKSSGWFRHYYSDIDEYSFKTVDSLCFRMDYKLRIYDDFYVVNADFDVHLSFDVSCIPHYGTNLAGSHNRISRSAIRISNYSSATPIGIGRHSSDMSDWLPSIVDAPIQVSVRPSDGVPSDDEGSFMIYPYSNVHQSRREDGLSNFGFFRLNNGSNYRVQDVITRRLVAIRPSSFLASSDALDKHILVIKANLLQTLQHLKDVTDLLPDLSGLGPLLAKVCSGDLSVIPEIIDYLTQAILRYRFQQRPTADVAVELVISNALHALEVLTKTNAFTAYGSFHFTFSDDENPFGDGTLVLVTRSKVRIHIDLGTLMVSFLVSNGLGLLPTLSRIWQLLPFTFVIDWFTNMSKRLHLVDNQVAYLAMRFSWALYSYKIVYYPSDELLSSYGLRTLEGDRFGISVYTRELSRVPPRLRDSVIDFLRPSHGPDPVTVGALLFQLLK